METKTKVHGETHTETYKLRGTRTLRETPSYRKRHTVLKPRHTHTEGVKHKQVEQEHTPTLREAQKKGERDRH